MGKVPIVALLVFFLTLALGSPTFAQRSRGQKTGSARAAYGEPVYGYSSKKKAKRKGKKSRRKTPKKEAVPLNRNRTKSPWVN